MPTHLLLLVLSFVLLCLATVFNWPRNPPAPSVGASCGWAGLAAFVLAALVP